MSAQGYNAGSIYVDLNVRAQDASKQIDEITRKIQTLQKRLKDLDTQEKALNMAIEQNKAKFGENSKEVQKLETKLKNLKTSQQLVANQVKVLSGQLQAQASSVSTVSKVFQYMGSSLKGSVSSINTLISSLNLLKVAIAGIAARRLYDALIVPGAELEQTITSLDVLLGSYEKAQKLTENLVELAAKTPLVTSDLTAGAKQLLAANVALEDIEKTLEMLGDVAMGSSETFESLVAAYSKIQTAGRSQLRNLYSFTTAGVPIIDALIDSLGITTEEFYKLSRAGQISADDVEKALASLTEEGGKFADMMDRQSKTYTGLLSTVADNFEILAQKVGDETLERLKGYLTDIIEEIDRLEKTGELDELIKQWGDNFGDMVDAIAGAVQFLYEFRDTVGAVITAIAGYKVIGFATKSISALASVAASGAGPLAALAITIAKVWGEVDEVQSKITGNFTDLTRANSDMTKSFKNQMEEITIQKKDADNLVKSLKTLTESEELETAQKEELYGVIEELNDIYPNLNLKLDEESEKINRNIGDIEDYIEAMKNRSDAVAYIDLAESLRPQILETKTAIETIDEQIENIEEKMKGIDNKGLLEIFSTGYGSIFDGAFDEMADDLKNDYILYEVAEKSVKGLREEREKLAEQLGDMEKQYDSYYDSAQEINEVESENAKTISELEQSWANADKTVEDVKADFQALVDALNESKNEFEGVFDELIGELEDLSDILSKEGETIELTKEEALKLAETYPRLADKIKITADSYEIERETLEELKQARIEEAKTAIDTQAQMTRESIEATRDRISLYNEEAKSITTLAEARAYLAKAQAEADANKEIEITGIPDSISPFDSSTSGIREIQEQNLEDAKEWVELLEQLEDLDAQSAAYQKQLDIVLANLESSGTSSASSSVSGETPDEAAIRNLKYSLDMELITYTDYYNALEKIKEKYYAKGSKEWQQYTLEIYKGRKQLEEENKAAELQGYEDRLANSYAWIEDEQFYERITGQGVIDAFNRIKKYTKEYYESGIISYERYVEEIKKLDKSIYSTMQENLQTSNDELSELRKKRYDEAVQQIEDYYDELQRAEEEAERKKQLEELGAQLALYEGAVTRAGQEKYKEIAESIEDIKKEGEEAAREVEKQSKLEELERTYNSLEEVQGAYFESVLEYSEDVTKKIQEMTALINSAFSSISNIVSGVSGTTNNTNNYQTIINQNNNISNETAGRAVVQMTDILYRYSPNKK